MKILKRVLEKKNKGRVTVDEIQFGFRPEGTIDAIFIVLNQEWKESFWRRKGCGTTFVTLEKAFDRVPREIVVMFFMGCGC